MLFHLPYAKHCRNFRPLPRTEAGNRPLNCVRGQSRKASNASLCGGGNKGAWNLRLNLRISLIFG